LGGVRARDAGRAAPRPGGWGDRGAGDRHGDRNAVRGVATGGAAGGGAEALYRTGSADRRPDRVARVLSTGARRPLVGDWGRDGIGRAGRSNRYAGPAGDPLRGDPEVEPSHDEGESAGVLRGESRGDSAGVLVG